MFDVYLRNSSFQFQSSNINFIYMFTLIKNLLYSLTLGKDRQTTTADLSGMVIIVTGASRGIGNVVAKRLLKEGATVIVVGRNKKDLAESFNGSGTTLMMLSGDITKKEDVVKITEAVATKYGKIDVLINNAGNIVDKNIEHISLEDFSRVMDVNVLGMFLMSQATVPFMKKKKQGFVINIGSKISHNTNVSSGMTLYAASKYAVEGFSFALNKELKSSGVRVTCLLPGTVNTFYSKSSYEYLNPRDLASLIVFMINHQKIDFESMVIKSIEQNI